MSTSDGKDNQCGTKTQPYGVAIGNALAKGYCSEDKVENGDEPDEDSRLSNERQAADGASEAFDDVSSSMNHCSRLAETIPDNCQDIHGLEKVNLRIATQEVFKRMWRMSATPRVCTKDCGRNCPCEPCKLREFRKTVIHFKSMRDFEWYKLWFELRDHMTSVFNCALKTKGAPNSVQRPVQYQCDPCKLNKLQENIIEMCEKDSQQLLFMLIVQIEKFLTELRDQLTETTAKFNKKQQIFNEQMLEHIAEVFLTQILDGYHAFVSTAKYFSNLLKPVEEKHLLKENLTWVCFNKALYENHIWMSEPPMSKVTRTFATQLTNSPKRQNWEILLERYIVFMAAMIAQSKRWSDADRVIKKCTYNQSTDHERLSDLPLDCRYVSSSTGNVVYEGLSDLPLDCPQVSSSTEPVTNERLSDLPLDCQHVSSSKNKVPCRTNPSTIVSKPEEKCEDSVDNEIDESTSGVSDSVSSLLSNVTDTQSETDLKSDEEQKEKKVDTWDVGAWLDNVLPTGWDWLSILKDIAPNEIQPCECLSEYTEEFHKHGTNWWANSTASDVLRLHYRIGFGKPCPGFATPEETKTPPNERPESPTSTTPNPTVPATILNHNHTHSSHQGAAPMSSHGSSTDSSKSTGPNYRLHAHNNHASHTCHKQAKVEHIKRVLCNDLSSGDGDCSDSGSSQEDSCSTSSSTPRDSSRHCDCCYCEVFGPGLLSVAPVSRNYNEMRERLRQLLTKKKAKKCKAPCSPPKSPAESSIASSTSTDHKATPPLRNMSSRSNTPIPVVSSTQPEQQRDQRDLEALLEFIEGNQGTKKDNKKTQKKARQKQRKLDEILRKAKEEADKQKLIELQKKTPEVTITVVDPLKPMSQRLPQRNLPEVSILPAVASPVPMLVSQKQTSTSKKKDSNKQIPQLQKPTQKQEKVMEKLRVTSTGKNKNATVAASPINLNMYDFVVKGNLPEKSKNNSKSNNSKNAKTVTLKSEKVQLVPPPPPTLANGLEEAKLTKKERKKLRREMKKLEAAKEKEKEVEQKAPTVTDNKPQIVTIKRVMESNSAEPTVTITLKGQTPAEDKVLFTLVNGQTKEPGSAKAESDRSQVSSSKKKKNKGNNSNIQNNSNPTQQQAGKVPQKQNQVPKQQNSQKSHDTKSGKQQQVNEKSKNKKSDEKRNAQGNHQSINETSTTKSKKDKKNTEVEKLGNQTNAKNKSAQQPGKNQNKSATHQGGQKLQQTQNTVNETGKKKSKGNQQQELNTQASKTKKKTEPATNKQTVKNENQKNRVKNNQSVTKPQRVNEEPSNESSDLHGSLLSSQLKDFGPSTKISIENLKLPPGITITKVDAPAKALPIKSAPMQKPVTATKQTTIIAAPMSGVQSSYPGPQTGGNVIVVDTGKLKQDLLPKNPDKKESQAEPGAATGGKKKKKKKKGQSSATSTVNAANGSNRNANDSGKENGEEGAKIVHNPGSNMVTIRNPAFGPAPKIDATPQAAIIKVSENGMVTIRSPALQQAINAGLTPPSQPDFIVKGDTSLRNNTNNVITGNRTTLTAANTTGHKNPNGIITPSLAEFRNRLASSDCNSLPGLANIQISKVTNGQPIPDRGINLRGTSVTLTKVRSPDAPILNAKTNSNVEDSQSKSALREAISATMSVSGNSKGKKKKKRGNGTKISGDDWNLVESVFTPKDIDLEDGEMDDAERELEAFKRFCLQSVPPPRKEKVNLNIKDIVLKKKSSSTAGTGAAIAAN